MYCENCGCEFSGWRGKCPVCKAELIEEERAASPDETVSIPYDALVGTVRDHGGELEVGMSATDVARQKRGSFPFFGYGYAWEKGLSGIIDDISVEMRAQDVGKQRKHNFPWLGYGFAWVKKMRVTIGGNQATLTATKVRREKRQMFPYFGYGRAWTEEMTGECGDRLMVEFSATEVTKRRQSGFPYRGYSYAWVNEGLLRISLVDE